MKYADDMGLTTNADQLHVGQALTEKQIEAIARLEDSWCEGSSRGEVFLDNAKVEDVLHAFICSALGECVCTVRRPA